MVQALFANWTTFFAAGFFYLLVAFFYPTDELKARKQENEDKIEKSPLFD